MTDRNFSTPTVAPEWADYRDTEMAVAVAIHAISTPERLPDDIWLAPSLHERRQVRSAIIEYLEHGDFEYEDGFFWWGDNHIAIRKDAFRALRDTPQPEGNDT